MVPRSSFLEFISGVHTMRGEWVETRNIACDLRYSGRVKQRFTIVRIMSPRGARSSFTLHVCRLAVQRFVKYAFFVAGCNADGREEVDHNEHPIRENERI